MTFEDTALREQTLFELWKVPSVSETEEALKEALGKINNKIINTKGDWTRAKQTEMFSYIAKKVDPVYTKFSEGLIEDTKKAIHVTFNGVDEALLNRITSPNRIIQGYTFSDLMRSSNDNHNRQLKRSFASGVARGLSPDQIVNEMKFTNMSLTKRQVKNAAFTYITESRAMGRHESYKQLEKEGVIEGYVYDATLDSRTTEYCRDHDNNVYKQSIVEISHLINTHFHCRSVFRPYNEAIKQRASIFGPTINESYSKWFARQEEVFQKVTLGPKKFNLYKEGKYTIGSVVDLRDSLISLDTISNTLLAAKVITDNSLDPQFVYAHIPNVDEFKSSIDEVVVSKKSLSIKGKDLNISRVMMSGSELEMTSIEIPSGLRGTGVAKKLYAQTLPEYQRLGITTLSLNTAKDGSIVWPKFGYTPTNPKSVRKTLLEFTNAPIEVRVDMEQLLNKMVDGDNLAFMEFVRDYENVGNTTTLLKDMRLSLALYLSDPKVKKHVYSYVGYNK